MNQYNNIYLHRECHKTSFIYCFIVTAENLISLVVLLFFSMIKIYLILLRKKIKVYWKWSTLDVIGESIKEHNANWLQIPYHLYRIIIIADSESGKTNTLLNYINHNLILTKQKINCYSTNGKVLVQSTDTKLTFP